MPTPSWECQGRQEHGWFGSGTCANPMAGGEAAGLAADCPGCALRIAAYATVGHLPRGERASYENWLNQGGLKRLEAAAPAWLADAGLDTESFRERNFGADGSTKIAGLAQNFGRDLRMALAHRSPAQAGGVAGESLAQLVREARPGGLNRATVSPVPKPATPAADAALNPRWLETTEITLRDPRSQAYDDLIQQELVEYNRRFAATPGFVPLDFRIFKAVLLVESGGPSKPEWTTQPYQIGNKNDAGLGVLQRGAEGASLIMSGTLAAEIITGRIDDPRLNIRAGIAYVLTRMIQTQLVSTVDREDAVRREYVVQPGDSLNNIAHRVGTTMDNLRQNNPGLGDRLRIDQKIIYQKAKMHLIIANWRPITATTLMDRYNGRGDALYARKIEFFLARLR